ncbi:MAG: hypothetical protein H7Y08_06265 [Rhizobiaceae bacterium]|nr:hypothetical protein [Rhizobiaceae bacterium]
MSGTIETLRQNIAALNLTSPVGVEVAAAARGSYRGEQVTASSEASKLKDAAEEIGMSVAHRVDKRSLGQREVRQGQGANLDALARIADYYDKLPDMPREVELQTLVESLENMMRLMNEGGGSGQGVTKDDVFAALQKFDPDVTHQFAGLEIAREFFAAAGADTAFQALLDDAQAEYQKGDLGRDVRAGLAASKEATQAAATLETDPAAVRNAYRQLLQEQKNMGQLFDAFRKFDVLKNFGEIVNTFMTAAGNDLRSTGPSTDPAYLHNLVTELAKLKKMQTVVDMSAQLMRTTDRLLLPGEKPGGDATDVASNVLNFASRASAGPADALKMLSRYEQCSLATQVSFANGVRSLHAELPDEVMPSPQARLQQNNAVLGLLDQLVEAEDREYENGAATQKRADAT